MFFDFLVLTRAAGGNYPHITYINRFTTRRLPMSILEYQEFGNFSSKICFHGLKPLVIPICLNDLILSSLHDLDASNAKQGQSSPRRGLMAMLFTDLPALPASS